MGFVGRLMVSTGAGAALFSLVVAAGGADFFADDFYTFTGAVSSQVGWDKSKETPSKRSISKQLKF